MRQLHPVSFHERFVASGTYVLFADGVATGDLEHWTLHEVGPGAWTIRTDHDGRQGSGANWLLEGFYDARTRRVERFDLSIYGVRQTDAKFVFSGDELQLQLRVDGVARSPVVAPLPAGVLPQPPALVAAFLSLVGQAGMVTLFVPDADFVAGTVSGGAAEAVTVEAQPAASLAVDSRTLDATHLRLLRRDSSDDIYLDTHHKLLRWQASTGRSAHLTQYVHRPEKTR